MIQVGRLFQRNVFARQDLYYRLRTSLDLEHDFSQYIDGAFPSTFQSELGEGQEIVLRRNMGPNRLESYKAIKT